MDYGTKYFHFKPLPDQMDWSPITNYFTMFFVWMAKLLASIKTLVKRPKVAQKCIQSSTNRANVVVTENAVFPKILQQRFQNQLSSCLTAFNLANKFNETDFVVTTEIFYHITQPKARPLNQYFYFFIVVRIYFSFFER